MGLEERLVAGEIAHGSPDGRSSHQYIDWANCVVGHYIHSRTEAIYAT